MNRIHGGERRRGAEQDWLRSDTHTCNHLATDRGEARGEARGETKNDENKEQQEKDDDGRDAQEAEGRNKALSRDRSNIVWAVNSRRGRR